MRSWWTLVFPAVTVIALIMFYRYYAVASLPRKGTTEWITRALEKRRLGDGVRLHRLSKKDIVPLIVIAILGAGLSYYKLGDTEAPQSFYRFEDNADAVITFERPINLSGIGYYSGLYTGEYEVYTSSDGENYELRLSYDGKNIMPQAYTDLFKWHERLFDGIVQDVKYLRIRATASPMELGELSIRDDGGNRLLTIDLSTSAKELFDEQSLIPDEPSYMNGTYFDEIYHGRTAYEYLNVVTPYETVHPPLGKLIIALGIRLFGMTPFGWRIMGATFGWLMLIVMYIFLKNMFGSTAAAFCGTSLFLCDFMRYAQTRIATIDTYGVFFILLAYYFMYRYIAQDHGTKTGKTLPPLLFSGLSFGVGCASKWITLYAGAGLAVIYLIHQIVRIRDMSRDSGQSIGGYIVGTLLFSVLSFVILPAVIYVLSYIPIGMANGMTVSGGMLISSEYYELIWRCQKHMLRYHAELVATHPYSSVWWQWVLDIRPILYYRSYPLGVRSQIAAFGNPVVWWGGILAIVAMIVRTVKYRDGRALFIVIGYLASLLPWLLVPRIVFIYHYFPCTLFLIMAQTYAFSTVLERKYESYRFAVGTYTVGAAVLFGAFFPVLSGIPVSEAYTQYFLRWIPQMWPF